MKKIILTLTIFLSLTAFSQQKYKVEIQPAVKISQSEISNANAQIEREVKKIYSKDEVFGLINKMFSGKAENSGQEDSVKFMESFFGGEVDNYFSKMTDLMYKYFKIEIDKIDYVSSNKAYVKVNISSPISGGIGDTNLEDMMGKLLENVTKMEEKFKRKTGKTLDEYSKEIEKEDDEKALGEMFRIVSDIQIEIMEDELKEASKKGKYVGRSEILEFNKKGNNWIVENPKIGY